MTAYIDTFESCPPVTRRTVYAEWKEACIATGEFSVFEATASSRAARFFDRLCRDPEVVTEPTTFPWIAVKRR